MKIFSKMLMVCIAYSYVTTNVFAGDITIYKTMLPTRFMIVNKQEQRCTLYGASQDPISYTCSSGQVDGDKEIEGDKKTPEGAYFVTGSILEGLDFEEYGSRAYPLNYPNPIDLVENKTGYGIWVHGKGNSFKPKGTRGCVAFPENDILTLYPNFVVSYPVIIADNVIMETGTPSEDYTKVSEAIQSWANAWSQQSTDFFSYYNPNRKPNFVQFVSNKRKIFSLFDFTLVEIESPHVVRKGKYYTTWFRQYYYAPNMLIEGTRYLYWEMGEDGIPHIIAEEWKADTSPSTKSTVKEKLFPQIQAFLAEWKTSWEKGDIKQYIAHYANNAIQDSLHGSKAIVRSKERNWKRRKPQQVTIENLRVALTSKGIELRFKQIYQASGKYKDIGEKTLYITPASRSIDGWKITKETWRKTRR